MTSAWKHPVQERVDWWTAHHSYVLESKGLSTHESILSAVAIDHANTFASIRALTEGTVDDVVGSVFHSYPDLVVSVDRMIERRVIDHLGFRIYTPMDIFFDSLAMWLVDSDLGLGGTKRFPASDNFQRRVGCRVEMAQAWLLSADTQIEIELFDIVRPMASESELRNRASLLDEEGLIAFGGLVPPSRFLEHDDIWHYGVRLTSGTDVAQIDEEIGATSNSHDDLVLLNQGLVGNRWHGSHHTKVRNPSLGLEVEFLSYDVEWTSQ